MAKQILLIVVSLQFAYTAPIYQPTDVSFGVHDLMAGTLKMELSYSDLVTLKEANLELMIANVIPFYAPLQNLGIRKYVSAGVIKRWPFYHQPENCKRFYGLGLRLYYIEIDPDVTEAGAVFEFLGLTKSAWTYMTLEPEFGRKWTISEDYILLLTLGGGPVLFTMKDARKYEGDFPPIALHVTINLGFNL